MQIFGYSLLKLQYTAIAWTSKTGGASAPLAPPLVYTLEMAVLCWRLKINEGLSGKRGQPFVIALKVQRSRVFSLLNKAVRLNFSSYKCKLLKFSFTALLTSKSTFLTFDYYTYVAENMNWRFSTSDYSQPLEPTSAILYVDPAALILSVDSNRSNCSAV